jgi:DNA-binding NarL/FixJ family response regulator
MEGLKSNPDKIYIAVVDDHNLFREGIVALLKDYQDLEVAVQAEDGKQFVKWLDNVKKSGGPLPHIVLLDIQMPEMNGLEASNYIKNQIKSNIPIIGLSANYSIKDIKKGKENGFSDFCLKPIDDYKITKKIIENLDR